MKSLAELSLVTTVRGGMIQCRTYC